MCSQAGGTQLGLVAMAFSSILVSFIVAFASSWKLTLVLIISIPFLVATGFAEARGIQGSSQRALKSAEQGGKVGDYDINRMLVYTHVNKIDVYIM